MKANYGYRVLTAKWIDSSREESRVVLDITGVDNIGLINNLTHVISEEMGINMDSINVSSKAGMFNGEVAVIIKNKDQLKELMDKIREMESIKNVSVK
jgi:GTP pyrophosphokinase